VPVIKLAKADVGLCIVRVQSQAFFQIQDRGVELPLLLVAGADIVVGLIAARIELQVLLPFADRPLMEPDL